VLSLINMNNDFAFVVRALETPCLFHFRSLKFHNVDSKRNLCQDVLTVDNIHSVNVCSLQYANNLSWTRQIFLSMTSTNSASRGNKKVSKLNRFCLCLSIVLTKSQVNSNVLNWANNIQHDVAITRRKRVVKREQPVAPNNVMIPALRWNAAIAWPALIYNARLNIAFNCETLPFSH